MTEYKSEFTFELNLPLTYQEGGDANATANQIILKAPSNRQRRECAELKQGFMRAIKGMANDRGEVEEVNNDKKNNINAIEILSILMMSKDVDFIDYQESFRKLLLNDVAWITEKQKLTSHMYDALSHDDTDRMLGEYLSNFLLLSLMSKLQG